MPDVPQVASAVPTSASAVPKVVSARQAELLESAYQYVLTHGITDLSLRPLAAAIGSSPRVLLYLYGSKDGLIRALLARARAEELGVLDDLPRHQADDAGTTARLVETTSMIWTWLSAGEHRGLLVLWVEAYARSLIDPHGPWTGFASSTVQDWLETLARAQSPFHRGTAEGIAQRTLALAVLRGALLDLLATGDVARTSAALTVHLRQLG
jgi:AcrR family transcriptional regulator